MLAFKKNFKPILLFVLGIFSLFECSYSQDSKDLELPAIKNKSFDKMLRSILSFSVPLIGVDELYHQIGKYQLLDTREYGEYKISHLKNAKWVGYNDFDVQRVKHLDKKIPVVCYCSVGYRSEKICEKLQALGFKEVYNLYGSIFEWANNSYPLDNSNNCPTDSIHVYNKIWGKFMQNKKLVKIY
ncbi:MAG: rhodanese-like domain-containing protein [Saprospiraceae bacterium]|nr:rhodanese-like domain-containing protein [Saprospiraceae bacterium]